MNAPTACGSSFAGIGLEILPRKSLRNTSLSRLSIVFSGQHAGKLPSSNTAPLRHQCLRWPYWNVPARHCSNLWTISGLRHEYKPWSTSLSDMTDIYEEGVAVAVCDAVDSVTLWGVACAKYLCYRCRSCCASFSIGSAGDLEASVCKQPSINVESPVGKNSVMTLLTTASALQVAVVTTTLVLFYCPH